MDLLDVAILLLRIALVGVLYLFLWVVVRSALRGLRLPATSITAGPGPLVLVVVEPGESGLEVGQRLTLRGPTVIGRAASADLVVDDAAVSAQHARLDWTDNAWNVADLGSTNGTRLNDRAVRGDARLRPGDTLELGTVRFGVSDT